MREDRRRKGKTGSLDQKLAVPQEDLDPNYSYRWANDDNNRIRRLEEDDWDVVDAKDPSKERDRRSGLGSAMCMVVGKNADGTEKKAYLMRKRKDWYEEDRKEKAAAVDATEEAIRQEGNKPGQYGEIKISHAG